jgi:hypothetical protein
MSGCAVVMSNIDCGNQSCGAVGSTSNTTCMGCGLTTFAFVLQVRSVRAGPWLGRDGGLSGPKSTIRTAVARWRNGGLPRTERAPRENGDQWRQPRSASFARRPRPARARRGSFHGWAPSGPLLARAFLIDLSRTIDEAASEIGCTGYAVCSPASAAVTPEDRTLLRRALNNRRFMAVAY